MLAGVGVLGGAIACEITESRAIGEPRERDRGGKIGRTRSRLELAKVGVRSPHPILLSI
jgi:hypothetical protein